jgi:very-short-patch-repair endonuclease
VDVELDGAAFHGSAGDRERDTRRDVALAALGWVVLRFSYRRLTTDPGGCRREIAAVCAARRRQLTGR